MVRFSLLSLSLSLSKWLFSPRPRLKLKNEIDSAVAFATFVARSLIRSILSSEYHGVARLKRLKSAQPGFHRVSTEIRCIHSITIMMINALLAGDKNSPGVELSLQLAQAKFHYAVSTL